MLSDVGKSLQSTLRKLTTSSTQTAPTALDTAVKEICNTLLHANVSPKIILKIRESLKQKLMSQSNINQREKFVNKVVAEEIIQLFDCERKGYEVGFVNTYMGKNKKGAIKSEIMLPENEEISKKAEGMKKKRINKRPHVILFVGLQGAGKTTTVCKYANYYTKRNFKVGIVCADTFRAGAFDQIKQNALKIKVPFYGSNSEKDPVKVGKQGVDKFMYECAGKNKDNVYSDFDIILVDSSGRNTQATELFIEMQSLSKEINPSNIILVLDAGIGQSAETHAKSFSEHVKIGSIILTKTDGTTKAGGALSSVASVKVPIEFIGYGEGMDMIEKFDSKRFVHKLLGLGDVEGLFEKLETLNIDEEEMMKKMKGGKFFLKDFHEQFAQLMSLGPMSGLLSMIPGMSDIDLGNGEDADNNLKKMMCIFDSLSKKELANDGSIFENKNKCLRKVKKDKIKRIKNMGIPEMTEGQSRVLRVAQGSGTSPKLVNAFLNQFKVISSMMKKMGKIPGFSDMANKDPSKMSLAEKTRMKGQLKGVLPKGMFDQMSQFFN